MCLPKVLAAMESQDADAFRAAVSSLPGTPDDHFVHAHPLIGWVARHGWGEVEILIEAGSQPKNLPGVLHMGIFPTFLWEPDVRALEALIEAGADVNTVDGERMGTPLQAASVVGEERGEAITKLLLAHGADPNVYDGSLSPLHQAVRRPSVGTVRALLEAGAEVDEPDGQGQTPLVATMLELLSANARSSRNDDDNSLEVASDFVPKTVALLLEHGADATERDPQGRSLLWIAFILDNVGGLIELLVDAGCPVDGTVTFENEKLDFLASAMVLGHSTTAIRKLIEAECPTDQRYELLGGNTAIGVLVGYYPDLAMELWDDLDWFEEALVGTRTGKGANMALVAAVTAGHEGLTRRLHAAGLPVSEPNTEGKTCLEGVREEQPHMVPVIEELLAAEADR